MRKPQELVRCSGFSRLLVSGLQAMPGDRSEASGCASALNAVTRAEAKQDPNDQVTALLSGITTAITWLLNLRL